MGDRGGAAEGGGMLRLVLALTPDPDLEPEDDERLGRQLRAELAELDIDIATVSGGGAIPQDAKGADPVTAGTLLVTLSASGGVCTALIATLRDWLGRRPGRKHRVSVTLDGDTLELEHATAVEQRDLVDAFLRRHTAE
ncbi:MAG: effector-associated constant component EACC1 [Sciscionella sp.]